MRKGCSDLSEVIDVSTMLARTHSCIHTVPHGNNDCESRTDSTFQESEEEPGHHQGTRVETCCSEHEDRAP